MSEEELIKLRELLYKLRQKRLEETDNYSVEELKEMDLDTLYEIDDRDNLIQGIDIVLDALPLN